MIEYLYFINDINEAESKLDAMRNMKAKPYPNKVNKNDIRDAIIYEQFIGFDNEKSTMERGKELAKRLLGWGDSAIQSNPLGSMCGLSVRMPYT